ncbi:Cytochrome P450 - like 10 [Theobroma cacao]|nr:Cytochrome P450 - like 10 [Theobroma cacao]
MFLYLFFFLALYAVSTHIIHKIRNLPPTPFPALPVIGHLHLLEKPLHRSLSEISKRHGPILLLQLGSRYVLHVSSPSIAEECLTKNDIMFANRPYLLVGKHFGYNHTSLLWTPYGDHWRNLRRVVTVELLSTRSLRLLSSIRGDEVRMLVLGLLKNRGQIVDMRSAFFELMLNVIMRMIAGKRYYSDSVEEVEEARTFHEMVRETFHLVDATTMADFLPVLNWFQNYEKRMIALQEKRDIIMQELIEESRNKMSNDGGSLAVGKKKTVIEVLLSLQKKEPENYKDEIIRSIMMVLLNAGTETSSGTMEWAMSLLLNNPEVLKKAQMEIDNVVGHDRMMDESDLAKLPYLHCIICETMRMYPVTPLLLPHESSKECMVGGHRVPRRTTLLVNMWAIQNDPNIWEEPTKFKPERFGGFEGPRVGFKLLPFGSGRRSCPGEGLAISMVGLTLGSLIQCFEWERTSEEMVDMTQGSGLTMPKERALHAKCRPRQAMMNMLSRS